MRDENSPTGSQNNKRVSFNPLQQFESMDGPSETNFESNLNIFTHPPPPPEILKKMDGMDGMDGMGNDIRVWNDGLMNSLKTSLNN